MSDIGRTYLHGGAEDDALGHADDAVGPAVDGGVEKVVHLRMGGGGGDESRKS